jgi:peptide/nickel transport system permease protein/dipeptide transport system permease protein
LFSKRYLENFQAFFRLFKRNKTALLGTTVVILWILIAIFATQLAPHDPHKGNLFKRLAPPAWMKGGEARSLLGTDHMGRDILSRIIYGSRISILIGAVVVFVTTTIGIFFGLVAGFYGGKLDALISRTVDVLMAFPYLVFAIGMMAVMGPGMLNLMLALIYKEWDTVCRVVRGEVLAIKKIEYIDAARTVGIKNARIMFGEILPNVMSPVIVVSTLRVATFIIMEASLSFLGLGVQPPTPAWGSMVSEGRSFIFGFWWISTFPGLAILTLVMGINLLGEGLRDTLDPRLKE